MLRKLRLKSWDSSILTTRHIINLVQPNKCKANNAGMAKERKEETSR